MTKLSEKDLPNETASLREIQNYVAKMLEFRGLNQEKNSEKAFIHLTEGIGEIARALRKLHGDKFADDTRRAELSGELADAFIILLDIARSENLDLFDSFIAKEKINQTRNWKSVNNKEEN